MEQQVDVKDAQDNKIMAVLAYLGILVLVPIFAAKESKFARFHANQGVVLIICEIAFSIVLTVVNIVLAVLLLSLNLGWLYAIIMGLLSLCGLAFLVLIIMGILNALKGEMKELPFIGKYHILDKVIK